MLIDRFIQLIPTDIRYQIRKVFELSRIQSMKAFHSQFIHPNDLVFDIGANVGDYADIFLQLGAKVICVEPQPVCLRKLHRRFNGINSVKIIEKGVAEKNGELLLHIDTHNTATATFSHKYIKQGPFSNRHWGEKVIVPVTTLDDLIKQYGKPKYCKIDVEGYELNVLKGLHTTVPFISFEYTLALLSETERCLEYLEKLGDLQLNFSTSLKTTRLGLLHWTTGKKELLKSIRKSLWYSGDVFVQFYSD